MRSWLRNLCVSQAAQSATPTPVAHAAVRSAPSRTAICEKLEDRRLLSASPFDVTNVYTGTIKTKVGKLKAKEAITVALSAQSETGFVSGQMSSTYGGTVDVKGIARGNELRLVGATSGRLVVAKINKKGKVLAGKLTNGIDDSVGKFKIKNVGDFPEVLAPAGRTQGNASVTHALANPSQANGRALTAAADLPLDPTIDPATGLPLDPVTGLPIDPAIPPGSDPANPAPLPGGFDPLNPTAPGTGGGTGGGVVTPPPLQVAAAGDLIGNNYSILGTWDGQFNFDSSGEIEDIATGSTTGAPVNGTRPGTDPRVAQFDTISQDVTGLVTGTLTIAEFGTFVYTGFVNGTQVDLVLSGPGAGLVTANMNATFDAFTGVVINAEANGFRANGPIFAAYTSGGVVDVPLPAGEELYHVDTTTGTGEQTFGNVDPNGASLGMDFSVGTTPLIINSLGAFDDGANGLNSTIRVAIYNTTSSATPIVVSDITTATSGLAPNSSFRYLTEFEPVTLTTGVYRIVAFGYNAAELAGDTGVDTYIGPLATANVGNTGREIVYPITNSLNANNYFSNPGGNNANLVYPTTPAGLPLNRYLAGSFLFEEGTPPDPGGGGNPTPPPLPPPPITKPANSAYPGGVFISPTGPQVFGSQSGGIIP